MSKEEYKDENKEEKPGGSSRLGKEAKIGVTVIALLLIVFGVVVAVRLTRIELGRQAGAAADREERPGESRPTRARRTRCSRRIDRSRLAAAVPPTVVPAKAASAKPPKTTAGDLDQWKLASDRGEAKRSGGGPSPGTPPPFMPDPPKPPHAERHERYALDPPAAQAVTEPLHRWNDVRLVAGADAAVSSEPVALRSSPPRATGVAPHGQHPTRAA